MPGIAPGAGRARRAARPDVRRAAAALLATLLTLFALAVTAGCAATDSGAPAPSTTPVLGLPSAAPSSASAGRLGGTWVQDLALSGDVSGRMTGIVPNGPGQTSQCTGRNSRTSGVWASVINGPVGAQVYGLIYNVSAYRGPGVYSSNLTVQLHSLDNARVWQNTATDPVNVTVDSDEESGTINARLTELNSAKTSVTITGRWSCRT